MLESLTGILNDGLGYIVPFVILLGLLVFVHELGHFLAAKFFKVRVETFSLGFGPKIIKFVRGGTVYCVSALPFGGYVKMYGDEPGKDVPEDDKKYSYLHKPVGQRIIIALAGPLMNLFFAIFLFGCVAYIGDQAFAPKVGEIASNSQAFEAGFRPYDEIKNINQEPIRTWGEVEKIVEESAEKSLAIQVQRGAKELTLNVTPAKSKNDNIFSTADRIGKIKGLTSSLHLAVIGVTPGGNFDQLGFESGDRVVDIDGEPVRWFKDIEPQLLETLFSGDGKAKIKVHRYKDFRKKDSFEEFHIEVTGSQFANQQLDIFMPETVIAEVQEDSPAAVAGLQRLDRIISINGKKTLSFSDIISNVSSYNKGDSPLRIEVIRDSQSATFEMTPQMNQLEGRFGEIENRFVIGVIPCVMTAPQFYVWKSTNFGEITERAFDQTAKWSNMTIMSFVRIFQNKISSKNVSGIISIGEVAQKSWAMGANFFLRVMAIISINLFILNLLPIPILDGGHLLLFTLEAIKGAPISLRKIEMAQQVGFLIILFLMAFALFNDFSRIFGS